MGPDAYDPLLADQDRDRDMEAAPATQAQAPSSWPLSATETRAPRLTTGSFSLARLGITKLQKRPVVRWAGLAIALGATVWLLYPYFSALGLLLDRRPGYGKAGSPSMAFPDVVDMGVVDVPLDAGPAGGGGGDAGSKRPPFGLSEPIFVGEDRPDWDARREKVKIAYKHALTGYLAHAFPNDELAPLTGSYTNKFVVCLLSWLRVDFFLI